MKLPKLQGVGPALDRLQHAIEARAEKLLARVERTDGQAAVVFTRAHGKLDAAETSLAEVDTFLATLDGAGDNGAPTSDGSLEPGSSESSADAPDEPHPQAGWRAG